MHKDLCRGMSGLCDAMRPTKGADLLKYLRKVNFTGELSFYCVHLILCALLCDRNIENRQRK